MMLPTDATIEFEDIAVSGTTGLTFDFADADEIDLAGVTSSGGFATGATVITVDAAEWDAIDADAGELLIGDAGDIQILTLDHASDSLEWATIEMEGDFELSGKIIIDGKVLTKEYFESLEQQIINLESREVQPMFTTINVLIIMLICVVTVKFVMPKLTLKFILRKFATLFYKPGKRAAADAKEEWAEAKKD